ncbi:hypothetical protein GGH91_000286 [Coemansia sp. RSA 2671]|nr:hypothetical protein LPJ60_003110 [Coemansia sp. RSA 2675]KAJ2011110.1 hypothetical protein GGI06_004662 [Coemansia sp. S85]KAJ2350193.1 hypothetical protein GGH91_000286 [Coemansia sp. RSA 2671]KAJ2372617.1 hypothetical protein H4S02_009145 [Coemansia sp. RSA 2611]KAJ2417617.1 hypothetical protein GGI10_000022 [Coemansia sp. RSA 2530]KAJ2697324.1 hypothetical protein H4218_004018 [Coemansia sp. IMI 209128]
MDLVSCQQQQPQQHHIFADGAHSHPRRRVKQLSSVKAWCQTYGMEIADSDNDTELPSYQSFPDLRRLLEEECAEIERRDAAARAMFEARITRRNSDPLAGPPDTSSPGPASSGNSLMNSIYRLIDPIIPVLGAAGSSSKGRNHL